MKAGGASNPVVCAQTKVKQPAATRVRPILNDVGTVREARRRGLAMATISAAKIFTAIVSVAALGATISFSTGTALAQDRNVTEYQIVRAMAPETKPPTRDHSTGQRTTNDNTATDD